MKSPKGVKLEAAVLSAQDRQDLGRLVRYGETKVAVRVLTEKLWAMRAEADTCRVEDMLRHQGGVAVLKEVISFLGGSGDERRDDEY